MSEHVFLQHLKEHYEAIPFSDFRKKSWDQLCQIGLATKSHEAFRYVHLRDLYAAHFEPVCVSPIEKSSFAHTILPECAHSHIIFVDGRYCSNLGDISAFGEKMTICSLKDAEKKYAGFLHKQWQRFLKEEKDPFALLNGSLHEDGLFVYVPAHYTANVPLQCVHICTQQSITAPRMHLVLGAHSQLRCVLTEPHFAQVALHIPFLDISLEESAHLDLVFLSGGEPVWNMQALRATLKKQAALQSLQIQLGHRIARNSYRVCLEGENSQADLKGLWALTGNSTAHTHTLVEHAAEHTRSLQNFKGVVSENSQSSFEGKILVQKQAQKTQAYQLNNNLIVSKTALANSKPNLEIFADDVKASHGSTVSQLDDDLLFYLNTRGIALSTAKSLLLQGFCREMIQAISYDTLLKRTLEHCERIQCV